MVDFPALGSIEVGERNEVVGLDRAGKTGLD